MMKGLFSLVAATLLSGCVAAKEKALKDAMYKIWNEGDLSVIDEAYSEELGNEVKRFVEENRDLYPDLQVTIERFITRGPYYITVWSVEGTHRFLNKPARLEGVSVRKREGGQFVEEFMYYDMKSVYDQLGFKVVPPEGFGPFGEVKVIGEREESPAEPEGEPAAEPQEPAEPLPVGAPE